MWIFALLTCSEPPHPPPAPQLPQFVEPSQLRFPAEAQEKRYHALRATLAPRWPAEAHALPTARGGSIEERWCPSPAEACRERRGPGAHLTLFSSRFPEIQGLSLWVRSDAYRGLILEVEASMDEPHAKRDQFCARFQAEELSWELSDTISYQVSDLHVRHEVGSPEAVAAALWASSTTLRELGQSALAALAAQVQAELDAGRVYRCTYSKRPPHGGAPECAGVPLNAAERAAEQQRLDLWLAERQALLATRSEDLHVLVRQTLPAALYGSPP